LEDNLSDYLDYYRKDIGEKVTIHHLLTHTSGIPSYTKPEFFEKHSRKHFEQKEFIQKFCSDDLEFEPGIEFSYNNSAYFILGAIIEEVTGKTYRKAMQNRVFQPLGMLNSGYDDFNKIIPKRASGYEQQFIRYTNADFLDMSLPYAAGALYSTVGDLYKWDRALYTEKLLSKKYLDSLFHPYEKMGSRAYGYGWFINHESFNGKDTILTISHGGGINGFNTLIYRDVSNKNLVVLLNNTGRAPLGSINEQIFRILYGEDYSYPKKSIARFMYEKLQDQSADKVVELYKTLKKEESESFMFNEQELNQLGYALMNDDRIEAAKTIFKLNIEEYPESYNVYDSMGEAYMKAGEKEKAIEFYKKSLELNPNNENGKEMLKKMGVEIEETKINLSEETLEQYTGKYQLAENFFIDVTREGKELFARATGQQRFQIFPQSETKFYLKVVDAQIEFVKNESGSFNKLILYQGGKEMEGNKVE
jgi:CubicO group peptidase (beta-lactamase class C family)